MTTKQTAVLEPLIERVDRLARELELAIRWDRPSILLAVYSSMYVMNDAAAALAARLREEGQAVEWAQVTNEADADVPLRLANQPQREGTVFFVSGLQWGGKTALRALNIRREYFVNQRLRAVFWLTENEAVAIAREASDFWAFRHRVVEFVEPPEPGRAAAVAQEMAWWGFEDRILREDTAAKIALREALLADLPEGDETLAARAELLFTLGGLYWGGRQYERAEKSFRAALGGARRTANTRLEARCHNGLGNVYAGLGRHEEAVAAYQRAIELDPKLAAPHNGLGNVYADLSCHQEAVAEYQRAIELDPQSAYPHNGLGNIYRALGRHEEALAEYQRAIELDPKDATPYNGLGNVYYILGRYDDAITEYQRAIELDPRDAAFQASFAAACRKLGREAEYAEHIRLARGLMADESDYNKACIEAVAGNIDEALTYLARALEKRPAMRDSARRDPDLDFIRHDPRFQELVGEGSDSGAQERKG